MSTFWNARCELTLSRPLAAFMHRLSYDTAQKVIDHLRDSADAGSLLEIAEAFPRRWNNQPRACSLARET